jgi:hypothetical protein
VGPGRRERGYLERIAALETTSARAATDARRQADELRFARAALELGQRVERGCQRRLDRLEERLDRREQELAQAHRSHKGMALALGALQRENELLRQRLASLPEPRRVPFLARWLGRAR